MGLLNKQLINNEAIIKSTTNQIFMRVWHHPCLTPLILRSSGFTVILLKYLAPFNTMKNEVQNIHPSIIRHCYLAHGWAEASSGRL